MIPNTKDRKLVSSGVSGSARFAISIPDQAHLMTILRDTLYSDKILAVLREYGANAWDAHRDAGKHDVPIKVSIPTSMSPALVIRDFGAGLSKDEVFQIYTQYGASTKRDSDNAVGMLGIGSKSGFAYSDSFTITSWHGGTKKVYIAVLDETEEGLINLLYEEPCDINNTGIEIQIAARPNDILEFHTKATKLFQYFEPRPDINITLPPPHPNSLKLKHGLITTARNEDGSRSWTAVMGCIPYRINVDQLREWSNGGVGVASYVDRTSGVLLFDIGEIQVSASREELKYSDMTKAALIQKFALLMDEYVQHTLDSIEGADISDWQMRLEMQVLLELHLPIPKDYKDLITDVVKFGKPPYRHFTITRKDNAVTAIKVVSDSTLLLHNDPRPRQHFDVSYNDYIVNKLPDSSWEEALEELNAVIKESGVTGIPVESITNRRYSPPFKKTRLRSANKKHFATTFKLVRTDRFYSPLSAAWEIIEREPTKDDVYVLLDKFKAVGYRFYDLYTEDLSLATTFGGTLPTIYGYKSTDKSPAKINQDMGTEYRAWRETFAETLLTGKTEKLLNYWEWSKATLSSTSYYRHGVSKEEFKYVADKLGNTHPITAFFKNHRDGRRVVRGFDYTKELAFSRLLERLGNRRSKHSIARDKLSAAYPLIEFYGFSGLHNKDCRDLWIDYILLIDKHRE